MCFCLFFLKDVWYLYFYVWKNGIYVKLDWWYYMINIWFVIFVLYCRLKCEDFYLVGGEINVFIGLF